MTQLISQHPKMSNLLFRVLGEFRTLSPTVPQQPARIQSSLSYPMHPPCPTGSSLHAIQAHHQSPRNKKEYMFRRFLKTLKKALCLLLVFCQNNWSSSLPYAISDIAKNQIVSHRAGTDQRISLSLILTFPPAAQCHCSHRST